MSNGEKNNIQDVDMYSGLINEKDELNNEINGNNTKGDKKTKVEKSNFFFDWIVPIVIAVILATLINKYVIFKVKIPSESMVPTLNVGDRLFVTRVYNPEKLKRGDVVVFDSEELNERMIKRLIGLPGDTVIIRNGVVQVNGETLQEDYIGTPDNYNGEFQVPEGKYFFLGDNRFWSLDSRYWENPYIDGSDITGKAQIKVYPLKDFGKIE